MSDNLELEVDTSKAKEALIALQAQVKQLEGAFDNISAKNLIAEYKSIQTASAALAKDIQNLSRIDMSNAGGVKKYKEQLSDVGVKASQLKASVEGLTTSLQKQGYAVGAAEAAMGSYRAAIGGVSYSMREPGLYTKKLIKERSQEEAKGSSILAIQRNTDRANKPQESGNKLNAEGERAIQWKRVQEADRLGMLNEIGQRQQHLARLKAQEAGNKLNAEGERAIQWKKVQEADRLGMLNEMGQRQQHLARLKAQEAGNKLNAEGERQQQLARMKEQARAEKLSTIYQVSSPSARTKENLKAAIAIGSNRDTSGFAPEAINAAKLLGSVDAARKAYDSLTSAQKANAASTKRWSDAQWEAHAAARGLAGSIGQLWMTYGQLAPLMAGAAIGSAASQMLSTGKEFEYQLTFVKALGNESAQSMKALNSAAKALSRDGMYGPVEVAGGLRILSQAGLSAQESLSALPHTLDLATVGEMKMEAAAITLVGVMNAFKLGVGDIGHIGDVFAKSAAVSQASVSDMAEAMKTASVVGSMYGATIEDTAAGLTLLAKVNIRGTAAGTSLRNMLKELYTPGKEASEMFKKLGVATSDSMGNMRSFPDIIYNLQEKLTQFDKASQTNILQTLFGERGAKEAIAMISQTREAWDELKGTLSTSDGFMRQVSKELEASTKGSLEQVANTLKVSMVEAFESTEGAAGKLAVKLKQELGSEGFKNALESIAQGVLFIANSFMFALPVIELFIARWVILKALLLANTAWAAASTAVAGLSGALITATGAMGPTATGAVALRGVVASLGASFVAMGGPVGLAVAGLAGFSYWIYNIASSPTAKIVEQTDALAGSMNNLVSKLRASNGLLLEQMRLKGLAGGSEVEDRVSDLKTAKEKVETQQKEAPRKVVGGFLNNVKNYGVVGGGIATAAEAVGTAYGLYTSKGNLKRAEADLKNAEVEQKLEEDRKSALSLKAQAESTTTSNALGAGTRNLAVESFVDQGQPKKDIRKEKISSEASRLVSQVGGDKDLSDKDRESTVAKILASRDAQLKTVESEGRKPYSGIQREVSNAAKDFGRDADQAYKRAMEQIAMDEKIAEVRKNNSISTEKEYADSQDKFNTERIRAAKTRYEEYKAEVEKLKPGTNKATRDDLGRKVDTANQEYETAVNSARIQKEERTKLYEESVKAIPVEGKRDVAKLREENSLILVQKQREFDLAKEMDPYQIAAREAQIAVAEKYRSKLSEIQALIEKSEGMPEKQNAYKGVKDELQKQSEADQGRAIAQARDQVSYNLSPMAGIIAAMKEIKLSAMDLSSTFRTGLTGSLDIAAQGFVNLATTGKLNIRSMVADMLSHLSKLLAHKAFTMIASLAMTAISASMFSASVSAATTPVPNALPSPIMGQPGVMVAAKGAPFSSEGVKMFAKGGTFTNQVVSSPTLFKFARGTGMMGEAGPEAIMPLTRDSSGRLGVRAQGAGGNGGGGSVVIHQQFNVVVESKDGQKGQDQGDAIAKSLKTQMRQATMEVLLEQKRPGGVLA